MTKKVQWGTVLGVVLAAISLVALVAINLSGCHVRDATASFTNTAISSLTLSMTKTDVQFHEVEILLGGGESTTKIMDSGPYLWNITGICTAGPGNVTIPAGTSSWEVGCDGLVPVS